MASRFRFVVLAAALLLAVGVANAQVATSGRLTGVVMDATQAAIPGANITVSDASTGASISTQSGADGTFTVGNLRPATYTVRVSSQGFKTAEYKNVKIVVGQTYTLTASLEVGEVQSTVTVEAGAEVLKTSETAVATTITGKAIQQLPFTSRDALDLGVLMPGAQTTGRPRNTSFMGLPKGAINITIDGINAQDNILKSSDGFFTTIRPRVDSIEEFSINTAVGGAEQAAEGAVQIRFETKRGSNSFHGGAWWYHRNDFLNSNYYFNNLGGIPRARQRLNQFGYSVGGPIWKDKLFFFHAFDFYRKPDARSRTRSLPTQEAASGLFRYAVGSVSSALPAWVTCNAAAGSPGECLVDVFALAAANGLPSTPDAVIGPVVQALAGISSVSGVGTLPAPNLFQQRVTFTNFGAGNRWFPDFRFDWNITNDHQISAIYHFNKFRSTPDFLNSRDFTYPVAPFNTNQASQNSDRNEFVGQWRYNLSPKMSNLFIFGVVSAPVAFFNDMSPAIYPQINTNLGAIRARPILPLFSTQPWISFGAFPRNTGIGQINDTFSWSAGKHSMSFGFSGTSIFGGIQSSDSAVATVRVDGLSPSDTVALSAFSTTNMPGISTTQRNNARALYSMLSGRVGRTSSSGASYSGVVYVDIKNRQFTTGVPLFENYRQNEFGFFGTDSWRVLPSLTVNYGLRWEYQGSPYGTDNIYFNLVGGEDGVFGVSGNGNLFAPGVQTGTVPIYRLNGNTGWYGRDLNNFAPTLGLAWNPSIDAPWYRLLFGGPNKSVFRAGYAINFTREGTNNWLSIVEFNPGYFGNQVAISGSDFPAGSIRFDSGFIGGVRQTPSSFISSFGTTPGDSVNAIAKNLRVPYVQSWSFGIQRELTPSTVLEVRYEGNHAPNLWRQQDLNETNIFENGFLQEFQDARNNMAICGCSNFSNAGLPGQVPLPIMEAAFGGTGSANFDNGTLVDLNDGVAGDLASIIAFDSGFSANLVAAGFPSNLFLVNPDATGGAFLLKNGAHSNYNSLVVEVRRRMSNGLQFGANYVWSKSLTNLFAVSSANFDQVDTLRDFRRDRGPSPFDIRHAFKFQGIYELPFGPGKRWSSDQGWLNRIIEGWEISFLGRLQSGRVTRLTGGLGGTFNGSDGGIEFVGITPKQLQNMAKVRQTPGGTVFYFPDSLIDQSTGTANFSMIRPCTNPGQFCQRAFVYGPSFFKPDINIVKNTKITERVNLQFRAEFLNAFNNINFLYAGTAASGTTTASISSSSFGQITNAYQDTSTTDDPGGRIIQFVIRVSF